VGNPDRVRKLDLVAPFSSAPGPPETGVSMPIVKWDDGQMPLAYTPRRRRERPSAH